MKKVANGNKIGRKEQGYSLLYIIKDQSNGFAGALP